MLSIWWNVGAASGFTVHKRNAIKAVDWRFFVATMCLTDTEESEMAYTKATVTVPWLGAIAARGPITSNTFYFDSGATALTPANLAGIVDDLETLYGTGLTSLWSSNLTNTASVRFLDLTDPPPRSAVHDDTFTITPGADSLPTEVSARYQYRGAYESGVSKRKFRGSLHLGPLKTSVMDSDGRLTSAAVDAIDAAFQTFKTNVNGHLTFTWVCGSEAEGFKPVSAMGMTNELGTVRRRQNTPTYGVYA